MDLKQLAYFVRVAELGSFTRASVSLGVAQPALSRQIRLLEVELRQNLLTRNGRGAVPTEAGNLLLKHGRGILHQVALAREELSSARGALAGRVSIGLPPSLSKLITVPLTRAFQQRLPDAQLTLTEGFSVVMYEGLRSGRLDMAVLYNTPHSPDIERRLLQREALVLISSTASVQRHQVAPLRSRMPLLALADLPLIVPSRPNAFRLLIDTELARLNVRPRIALEVDGLNAILDLVREGLGFAVLPPYTLSNFPKPHDLSSHRLQSPQLMSELMLVTSAQRPSTETHKEVQALVARVVQAAVQAPEDTA